MLYQLEFWYPVEKGQAGHFDPNIKMQLVAGGCPQAPKSQDKSCGCAFFQNAYVPLWREYRGNI